MSKKVNLADVDNSLTSISTSYAGEFAGEYISAALLSGNTLSQGAITIKPNVKHKEVIKKLDLSDALSPATCDFTLSPDQIVLSERILEPTEIQLNLQLCKKDFRSDWEAMAMGVSAHDQLPPSFADFLIAQVAAKVAETMERTIWSGDTAGTYSLFDGLVKKIAAEGATNTVTGTSIDASNVIDELGKVVDAIPSTVYGKEDLSLHIPQNVARAYVRALGGFSAIGANGTDNKGTQWWNGGALSFDGVNIFVANGLSNNTIVAAEKSNLFFGTGLLSDANEVKVIDMADVDGSQNVRMILRATAGVQIGIADDIVLYQ